MSLRELCDDLTQKHNLTVVTEIYQGESPVSIGPGVCRSIVAHWIASNLNASAHDELEFVRSFREKARALHTGETAESFVAHQHDYDFHVRKFEEAEAKYNELKSQDLVLGEKITNYSPSFFGSSKETLTLKQQQVQEARQLAYEEAMEIADKTELYKTMFVARPERVSRKGLALSRLILLARYQLSNPGFYFIGIGKDASKHAVGFYTSGVTNACMFIDPNTCEWVLPDLQTASAFLAEYMNAIKTYKLWMDEVCTVDYVAGGMLYEPLP